MTCQIWEKVIYNKISLLKHYSQEKEQNLDFFVEEQVPKTTEDQ